MVHGWNMSGEDSNRRSFSIITFGCKLNQYESECIRHSLLESQWECHPFEEGAQFCIINSCTVTGKSDSRSRNAARRAKRISPDSIVIMTGCYAEIQPEQLGAVPEIDLVLGNRYKGKIPRIMDDILGNRHSEIEAEDLDDISCESMEIKNFHGHSRAFIKIQEGCSASCSYCIIPRARGRSRSVPTEKVMRQLKILEENGYNEIVLTGIHIGRYGADLNPRRSLIELLEQALDGTNNLRVRLSSIEVTEITPELIRLVAGNERVAPHLHIPLQSGDDEILTAMNRPYGTRFYRDTIHRLSSAADGIAIGTDVIAGFPGETKTHFANTYELIKQLPLSYLHVFNFSRRPGTRAETMPGHVPAEERKKRSKKLIKLGKSKKRLFMKSLVGKSAKALIQGPVHKYSRFSRTLSGNYCEVYVKRRIDEIGTLATLNVTHYSRGRLYGIVTGGRDEDAPPPQPR
jgi:threonylcarbamoyladenosine tRNA methylthiotransferase MtaB